MGFEEQALSALAANKGKWYCPPCWGAVAGIMSPEDLQKLSALAKTVIEAGNDFERVMTNKENAPVCTRYGQPGCDFGREGRKRSAWGTWDFVVRAKPRGLNV
jgi:hypothetical protein